MGWIGRKRGVLFCEGIIKGRNGLRFRIICSVQYWELDVIYCEWVWTRLLLCELLLGTWKERW